jgi:glutathione S-transferase
MKPWLLMHQRQLEFELTLIDVLKGEQKSPEYLKVNPLGVVPYMITPEGVGIGESNAMLWYLAHGSPLMPNDRTEQAEALQWMFFEQSKLEPYISPARFFTTILPQEKDARAEDIAKWQSQAEPGLHRLDAYLSDRDFILKSGYSIVDIALYGYVHVMDEAGISRLDYPEISRWIDNVAQTDRYHPLSELGQPSQQAA